MSNHPRGGKARRERELREDGPGNGIIDSVTNPDADNIETVDDSTSAQPPASVKPASVESTPAIAEVNPETETVEGRLNKLTDSGSKYIELARGNAERAGNRRGMINSAMSAGAGEEAAIRAALPIAQQDAISFRDQSKINQSEQNKFNINQQSADLNMAVDSFRSELAKSEEQWSKDLQTKMELTLANEKLSNDTKFQYVQNIAQLTTDATNQIVDIGLSDRTAEAQAAAIVRVEQNRDASIKVYEDLLKAAPDWNWGTEFTPKVNSTTIAEEEKINEAQNEPAINEYRNGKYYNGNGNWSRFRLDDGTN